MLKMIFFFYVKFLYNNVTRLFYILSLKININCVNFITFFNNLSKKYEYKFLQYKFGLKSVIREYKFMKLFLEHVHR